MMDNLNALTLLTKDIEAVKQQFSCWRNQAKNKGKRVAS